MTSPSAGGQEDRADEERLVIGVDDLDTVEPPTPAPAAPPTPAPAAPPTATYPSVPKSPTTPPTPAPVPPLAGAGAGAPGPGTVGAQAGLPSIPTGASPGGGPPRTSAAASSGALRNPLVVALLAGTLAGIAAAVTAEVLFRVDDPLLYPFFEPLFEVVPFEHQLKVLLGIWLGIFAAVLGFVLRAWDGLTSGAINKAFVDGVIGALVGLLVGFISGVVAQTAYEWALGDLFFSDLSEDQPRNRLRGARMIGWAIFGMLLGAGIGIQNGARRIVFGLLGGAVGGAFGGIVFQELVMMVAAENPDAEEGAFVAVRVLAMTITAVGIAFGVSLVERMFRDSWMLVSSGPMAGKEYILYKPVTTIGSDYRCDIVLAKDPHVGAQHAQVQRDANSRCTLRAIGPVAVNGAPSQQRVLSSGDHITVGATTITYQDREQ